LTAPRYPEIEVQLTGEDGNAFAILGRVRRELRRGGVDADEIQRFFDQATFGDYDFLLSVCQEWVTCR